MSREQRRFRFFDDSTLAVRPRLLALSVLAGAVCGLLSVGYLLVIHVLQHALWPDNWEAAAELLILPAVGIAVAVIGRTLGRPSDFELLVDNIHVSGGMQSIRELRALVPMSLLTISAGAAMGPESPVATTMGSLSGYAANRRGLSVVETRSLSMAGIASGLAVLFGAPLGAALLSLEILHRRGLEYTEALIPSLTGALMGYACSAIFSHAGILPVWHIPDVEGLHAPDMLWAAGVGVVSALVAVIFTYTALGIRKLFGLLPQFVRPIVGGLTLALLGCWSGYALTFGEAQTSHVLAVGSTFGVGALLVALVAKLLGTTTTLGSSWPGGFIIPLFFMGACLGQITHSLFASAPLGVVCAAFMAAVCVGVTKTVLGSTLVVTEMGGAHLLPTTLLAAVVTLLLTSNVGLIHSQRERSED
jgi:H+/Cl- antiporter ClcA